MIEDLKKSLMAAKMQLSVSVANGYTVIAGSGGLRFEELSEDIQNGGVLIATLARFEVRNIETKDGKKYAIANKVFSTCIGEVSISSEFPTDIETAETVNLKAQKGKPDSTGNSHWIKWVVVSPSEKKEDNKQQRIP